ncbi:ParE family toxin-like protein [Nostoc sp.]|uniref:ParE family toxin-like protein n=1 Tax=Nostoc sp. TaxID=1180 RepID=UPI002FF4939C
MRHRASPNFWYCYRQLPSDVQEFTDRCYELLKQDPRYPSLHFKKVGRFWSVRVGLHYRALAVEQDDDFVWFWIGSHAKYEKLLEY